MHHNRQFQFICKLNLPTEPVSLHIAWRQVIVEVEPDFADCLDFRFAFCNLAEAFQHRLVHQLRIMWVHSDDRIAPRIAICVLGCQKARGLVEAHIHHQPNIRGFDFRCQSHALLVCERIIIQMCMCIKQHISLLQYFVMRKGGLFPPATDIKLQLFRRYKPGQAQCKHRPAAIQLYEKNCPVSAPSLVSDNFSLIYRVHMNEISYIFFGVSQFGKRSFIFLQFLKKTYISLRFARPAACVKRSIMPGCVCQHASMCQHATIGTHFAAQQTCKR